MALAATRPLEMRAGSEMYFIYFSFIAKILASAMIWRFRAAKFQLYHDISAVFGQVDAAYFFIIITLILSKHAIGHGRNSFILNA